MPRARARYLVALLATAAGIALALSPATPAAAQVPSAERQALIALYNATGGAGWKQRGGSYIRPVKAAGFALRQIRHHRPHSEENRRRLPAPRGNDD